MKNKIPLVVCLFFFSQFLLAQCPTSPVTLTTQAQVDAFKTNYPGCTELPVDLSINGNTIVNLDSLDGLTKITGTLSINSNPNLINLDGLGNLEFISGSLLVGNNILLETCVRMEKLETIGLDLVINANPKLASLGGFPGLKTMGGSTIIHNNSRLSGISAFPKLTSLGGSLNIYGNSKLEFISDFDGLSIISNSLSIEINTALKSIAGFQNLAYVNGGFRVGGNSSLDTISGFNSLLTCGKNLDFIENSIRVIDGFRRLKTISGDFIIRHTNNLTDVSGFDSLTTINGSIDLYDNLNLVNIQPFIKLDYIQKNLSIRDNTNLTSLDFLPNLAFVGGKSQIYSNPKLANCEVLGLCKMLFDFPDLVNVYGNAPGCHDKYDLTSGCTGIYSYASGRAWADFNCDSIFNSFDIDLGNRIIRRLDDSPFATTTSGGKFTRLLQPEGPVQSFKLPDLPGFQTLPVSRQVQSHLFSDSFPNQNFRLCPVGEATNLCLSVASSLSPRPGFSTTYTVCMANIGNTLAAGTILFDMTNPVFKNYVANLTASDNPINAGNVLTWNTDSILPFSSICITVTIKWMTTLPIGEYVSIQVNLNPINAVDIDYNNNIVPLRQHIVGSYDPNDKTVNIPVVGLQATTKTVQLDYQIRFQNTGNFPASFIEVIDTLPYLLDSRTIEMLGSSHPYSLEFPAQNVLKWRFDDINLPDSTSDEAGSHGWLLFRIKTRTGLLPTDTILNRCGIYFDFNAPVLTGFAQTWFSKEIDPTDGFSASFHLTAFPNPTEETTIVQFRLDKPAGVEFQLFDYAGKLMEIWPAKSFSAGLQLVPVSLLEQEPGIYFLEMKTESGRAVLRLVRQ